MNGFVERRRNPDASQASVLIHCRDRDGFSDLRFSLSCLGLAAVRLPEDDGASLERAKRMEPFVCAILEAGMDAPVIARHITDEIPNLPLVFFVRERPPADVWNNLRSLGSIFNFPISPDSLRLLLE